MSGGADTSGRFARLSDAETVAAGLRTPSQPPTVLRGPMPTLWHSDGIAAGWELADDLIVAAQPPAVQLHAWEPAKVADRVRRLVPGVALVVGVGVDSIARSVAKGSWSVARGVATMVDLAQRAVAVGAVAICWNAEAGWKRPPNTAERTRIEQLVREGLAAVASRFPALLQWHTAYDHPSYHSTYPWKAWLGPGSPITASFPQVYAAPEGGLMAHRGALPAREVRSLASWSQGVRAGWIRPDVPEGAPGDDTDVDWRPYYQLHHVAVADTVASAVAHPLVALWALPTRADAAGRRAFVALTLLARLGFWGEGAVQQFQAAHPEAGGADGVYGPRTEAALVRAASAGRVLELAA